MSESTQPTSLTSFGLIIRVIMSITDWATRDWWTQRAIKKFEENTFELDMSYDSDDEDEWGQFIIIDNIDN